MGTAIVVTSGKGGTGKTSITGGVAGSLARLGHSVLCIDMDIGLRNLDISLGLSDRALMDFSDVAEGRCPLVRAAVNHPDLPGLALLTAPMTLSSALTEEAVRRMLDTARSLYDYVLIDSPAGLGTGFAGMSAAAVISPMLITFLGMDPYMAVGIALASDVLASAISAYTYGKSGNLDIKNGAVMMASVLCFTLVGSYVASLVPGTTMGGFSTFMTLLLGVKFIVRPVMTTKSAMNAVSVQKRFAQSLLCGAGVGFICGFIGAGGGMMMLLLLTSVLGYELKTAVGTSVFIMAFTAFTGSVSHFAIGGVPDLFCLICCVLLPLPE